MDKLRVIEEKDSFFIIEKPSGYIVNEAKTTKGQPVIQTILQKDFDYPISDSKEHRSGIVHRLDKETSGILIIAKTIKAFKDIQKQFREREVKKTYKALAHGKVEIKKDAIEVPVGRQPWNREKFGVIPGGRSAKTDYEVDAYYKKGREQFTYLSLFPKTGRTHQIRVHLKYLKHPIVSDELYAGRKRSRRDRKWCPRLFLHAAGISFNDPNTGKKISVESDLPEDLSKALSKLEKL